MAYDFLTPDCEIINETTSLDFLSPSGSIINETVVEASGGVPKTTKLSLLGVG